MSLIFITGGAGFIGFHLQKQLEGKFDVNAIDLLSPNNKAAIFRSKNLANLVQNDIASNFLDHLNIKPDVLIHLAAETGIAGSLTNPDQYFETNLQGTFNVLEQCRKNGVKYIVYASSSSVYSPNQQLMSEESDTKSQLSFYGTSKKMSEIMIENYCAQFGLTAIGLRFFTVYGSWTRPDMAAYKFMKNIDKGLPINIYNNGNVFRDFTHVSDIVKSIELLIKKIQFEPIGTHKIFNIGLGSPISVLKYATLIADAIGNEPIINFTNLPTNELIATHSNTNQLEQYVQYKPSCKTEDGINEMVAWYKNNKYE
jgi:UDP-glucuronate 4-epimerase